MKSKRILLSLCSLIMLLFVLISCTPQGGNETTTDNTEISTGNVTEAPSSELVLLDGGEFKFTVIRPEITDEGVISAATAFRNELEKITGASIIIKDDFKKKGSEHDPSTFEILFGNTNYTESAEIYDGLCYGQYRIAVKGNKIVIAASDGTAASKAAYAFTAYIEGLIENGRAVIPATYFLEKSTDSLIGNTPIFNLGSFENSYTGTYGEKCYIYRNTTAENFNSYLELAQNNGCTLHASAEMGNNLSATLKNGNAIINVFFTPADKKTRIMIDDIQFSSLPLREEDNNYKKICDSALVQLGLEQPYDGGAVFTSAVANYNNGMGYIFRLHDGSFIIIDGGFNKNQGAVIIYEKLCELAPDKNNIVIAAWIFSHQHGDHTGAFRKFTERYSSKVKLERVIYNMPNAEELESVNEGTGSADSVRTNTMKYHGAVSSIAHPGQVHYIRNAKIEVLHSIDLLRPSHNFEGGNSMCICVKITIEGQTYMFAGDSYPDMTSLLIKHYGDYLKSDFCQIVHHGAKGASNEFYKAVDPSIVLWPLGTWDYYPWRRYETFNTYIFESQNVKEIILAGFTDRTLSLPYTFPTEKVLPEEIEVTWNYLEGKN